MNLYYDSRIRKAVLDRWAEYGLGATFNSKGRTEISEDHVDPEDSPLLKDTAIPLDFKNSVARDLYKDEDEETKERVRAKRDEDIFSVTVYNTEGEERAELVRAYQR